MGVAVEHSQKTTEGTDGFAERPSEKARDLVQVGEVVGGPGREKFAESDGAKSRMTAGAREVDGLQVKGAQSVKRISARRGEFVEEIGQGSVLAGADIAESIECRKVGGVAVLEDDASAWDPVGAFGVDEVGNDLAWGHGVGSLVLLSEGSRKAAQERIECGGRSGEECGDLVDGEKHGTFFLRG